MNITNLYQQQKQKMENNEVKEVKKTPKHSANTEKIIYSTDAIVNSCEQFCSKNFFEF